jgi:ATP-binding cassette subfamily B (MDR/TAP) protein 1
MTYSLKNAWFDALLCKDMAYFDSHDMSATALDITTACSRFKDGVGRKLGEGVQFLFTFLGGFAYAFYCSWSTSLVLLAVVPFMSSSILFLMKITQNQAKKSNECYSEAGSIALMAASAIRTVNSLNATNLFIDKYCSATQDAYRSVGDTETSAMIFQLDLSLC